MSCCNLARISRSDWSTYTHYRLRSTAHTFILLMRFARRLFKALIFPFFYWFSLFVWYCVQFTRFYAILPNWGEQLKLSLHHWVLSANRGFGQWISDRFLSINQSIRRSSQNVARQLFIFRSLSVVFTVLGSVHEILDNTSDWFWDTYLIKPKKSHRI